MNAPARTCPRCKTALDELSDRDVPFLGCGACFGLWVGEADLAGYVHKAATPESGAAFERLLAKAIAARSGATASGTLRACPVCKLPLVRLGYGENPLVILDRCPEHGLWLDRTELKKVVRAARAAAHPHAPPPPEDE